MTPAICLRARELLNWTQHDLALRARCSLQTIRNVEREHYRASTITRSSLLSAFEEAGLEFTEGNAPDVRFRSKQGNA